MASGFRALNLTCRGNPRGHKVEEALQLGARDFTSAEGRRQRTARSRGGPRTPGFPVPSPEGQRRGRARSCGRAPRGPGAGSRCSAGRAAPSRRSGPSFPSFLSFLFLLFFPFLPFPPPSPRRADHAAEFMKSDVLAEIPPSLPSALNPQPALPGRPHDTEHAKTASFCLCISNLFYLFDISHT